jgi:hypothetical protein
MISLTLVRSQVEFISDIPSFVVLSTDVPATVYYTLDGTTPDATDLIAVGNVYLPTNSGTVVFKAIAISPGDSSTVLSKTYTTTSLDLNGPRRIGEEGISILPPSAIVLDNLSVDSNGAPAQETSIEFNELEVKASTVDSNGVELSDGKTSIPFINFPETLPISDRFSTSSVNDNSEFDPKAKYLIVDGSTQALMDNQVVKLVNRTHSTFGPTTKLYDERLGESEPIVTGNYVKSFYNEKNGLYISYYWESLESRWIKSVQKVESITSKNGVSSKNHFVYRWIQDRSVSRAF